MCWGEVPWALGDQIMRIHSKSGDFGLELGILSSESQNTVAQALQVKEELGKGLGM